jgi:hypothetical protein
MTTSAPRFTVRKFASLAALGAVGVSLVVLGLFAIIAFGSAPTPSGGIDRTNAVLAWIGAAIPAAAIIAAHLAYVKVLLDESRRNS